MRFRLNHLTHLNWRFNADFSLDYFYPRVHYDPGTAAVESHLTRPRTNPSRYANWTSNWNCSMVTR